MFESFSSLWFNVVCFCVHLLFGSWLLADSVGEFNVDGFSTRTQVYYSRLNGTDWPRVTYSVESYGTVNIVLMLALFELITAVYHGYYSWFMYTKPSEAPPSIKYRYLEYGLTAPIMIVIISVLFGLRDAFTLLSLALLCASTMMFGALQSWSTSSSTAAHFMGWAPFLVMWFIILSFFYLLVEANSTMPSFVVIVLWVELVLFGCFGVVQFWYEVLPRLQHNGKQYESLGGVSGRSADGLNNLLSLLSKLLLAGIVYGNLVAM